VAIECCVEEALISLPESGQNSKSNSLVHIKLRIVTLDEHAFRVPGLRGWALFNEQCRNHNANGLSGEVRVCSLGIPQLADFGDLLELQEKIASQP